jgi:hypothetical protein
LANPASPGVAAGAVTVYKGGMAPDRLRDALKTAPFRPFNVELPNGKKVPVKHPDYAFLSPAGRTLIVEKDNEGMEMIDVFLITNLSFTGLKKSSSKR